MTRLPTPGQDDGTWGTILNDFLTKSHDPDGTLATNVVGASQLQDASVTVTKLVDGTITASKLAGNIPSTKLDTTTQTQLSNIGTVPDGSITTAKIVAGGISESAITNLPSDLAAKYVKPGTGIPKTDLESGVQTSLNKADSALQSAPVVSVAGKTGAVTLTPSDVGAPTTLAGDTDVAIATPSTGQVLTYDQAASKWKNQAVPSAPVTSVAGKTGAVTLTASDAGAVPTTDKGVANGVATLDGTTHIPTAQIPDLSGSYATTSALTTEASTARTNEANASLLTTGTVADARLPVTAQAATLNSTYAPVSSGALRGPLNGKLRGGNIVVKPGGWGWRGLFSEWDWDNWIRPQVDRALALGLNAVRLIGGPSCVFTAAAGMNQITQAQYIGHWTQLADYCQAHGLALYPAPITQGDFDDKGTGMQDAALTALTVATAQALDKYRCVIGLDLFQEGGMTPTTADVLAMMAAIRGAGVGLPLTCSHGGSQTDKWTDTVSVPAQVLVAAGGSDYADYHIYTDDTLPTSPDLILALAGKPFLIGEFGAAQSDTTAVQTARYVAVAALHNRPGVLGSFLYGLADQVTYASDEWGVWDNTGFGPAFPGPSTTPLSVTTGRRTAMTSTLAGFLRADKIPKYDTKPNMLTIEQQTPAVDPWGWTAAGNTSISAGVLGLGVTSTAAGDCLAATIPSNGHPVTPGIPYQASVTVLAGATPRTVSLQMDWYNASNTWIGASAVVTGVDSLTAPLTLSVVAAPPVGIAFAVIVVKPLGAVAGGEVHWINKPSLALY